MIPWDPKKQAHAIVSSSFGPEESDGGGSDERTLDAAAADIVSAVNSGDASAVKSALVAFMDLYEGSEKEE